MDAKEAQPSLSFSGHPVTGGIDDGPIVVCPRRLLVVIQAILVDCDEANSQVSGGTMQFGMHLLHESS